MEEKKKHVKNTEDGDVILTTCALLRQKTPSGLPLGSVILSRLGTTILWFIEFLAGTESESKASSSDGRAYHAFRNTEGVFLREIREGNFVNYAGFSNTEIPEVLEELRNRNEDNSEQEGENETAIV